MAIDQGTETVAISTQERTWRITIETPKGQVPTVTIYRQVVRTLADGTVLGVDGIGSPVQRSLVAVAGELQDFTPSQSGKITGGELAALIAARADKWRLEDLTPSQNEEGGE